MDPHLKAPKPGQWRVMAMLAALTSLAACGGGGGAAPTPPPPQPAPAPAPTSATPIAAQLSVPTPVGYDADRLAAFNRLNEIRLAAGLGMLAQNVAMDQAAQAHAEWMVANDSFTHEEVDGTPGFTATTWPRRDELFGYVPLEGAEVIAGSVHGAAGVDVLVNGPYHRAAILVFESVDVGIGWTSKSTSGIGTPLVIDMSRPGTDVVRGLGQSPQPFIDGVATWPIDNARDVPLRLGLETPNPVPTQDILTLGTPASVAVAESKTISVSVFTLTNMATGLVVPSSVLTSQSDPNQTLPRSFAAVIPLAVLAPSTTYKVEFDGSVVAFMSATPVSIHRAWSFKTAAQ
jgi:uncharacterized protein YkwD